MSELLPVLSSRHLSRHIAACAALVWGVQCTMPVRLDHWQTHTSNRMQRNDRAMIRQICNVKPQDIVTTRSNELLVRPVIEDLDLILIRREGIPYMDMWNASKVQSRQPLTYRLMKSRSLGSPKMTWKQLTKRDCREWKLSAINLHDTWRSGVRSAMRAASQLPGRGPTDGSLGREQGCG